MTSLTTRLLKLFEANLPRFSGDLIASRSRYRGQLQLTRRILWLDYLQSLEHKSVADPFGLRRTAYGLVQTLVNNDLQTQGGDVRALFGLAKSEQPVDVATKRWKTAGLRKKIRTTLSGRRK